LLQVKVNPITSIYWETEILKKGPDIMYSKIVVDSKLKAEEAALFEGHLSLEELDEYRYRM
jgi:hypothetical protein